MGGGQIQTGVRQHLIFIDTQLQIQKPPRRQRSVDPHRSRGAFTKGQVRCRQRRFQRVSPQAALYHQRPAKTEPGLGVQVSRQVESIADGSQGKMSRAVEAADVLTDRLKRQPFVLQVEMKGKVDRISGNAGDGLRLQVSFDVRVVGRTTQLHMPVHRTAQRFRREGLQPHAGDSAAGVDAAVRSPQRLSADPSPGNLDIEGIDTHRRRDYAACSLQSQRACRCMCCGASHAAPQG